MNEITKIAEIVQQIETERLFISGVILIFFILIAPILAKILVTIFGNKKKKIKESSLYKPAKYSTYVIGLYIAFTYLKLPAENFIVVTKLLKITIIILVSICISKMISVDSRLVYSMESKLHIDRKNTVGLFFTKVLKGIITLVAGFIIITELGYNINGLLASIGIGGVVIALAAQDIAKNFFGGLTIIIDKPFKVGDWVEMGGISGTVEDITFRSTRLRTFNGTIAIIPNSVLSNENLICNSNLKYRKYIFNIAFTLDTPLEKINNFILKAYQVLEATPNVLEDSSQISFDKICDHGFNMYIFVNTDSIVYTDYLKFKEMINFKIMQLIESENIKLAYPTQTLHIEK